MAFVNVHQGLEGPVQMQAPKDPDATWIIGFIWDQYVDARTTTVTASVFSSDDFTLENPALNQTDTIAGVVYDAIQTVEVSGGTGGTIGAVRNRVTMANGEIDDRTINIFVQEQ